MTREEALKHIEECAAHFGLSTEEFSKRCVEELQLKGAIAAGVPDWVIDAARATPTSMLRDIALRDNRAPTGPSAQGCIPSSQQMSNVRPGGGVPGGGTGWAREIPLGPQPGIRYVDAQCDAQDAKDRVELAQRLGTMKR